MLNALTVDLEDYFQVQAFAKLYPPEEWDKQRTRLLGNVIRTLQILDEYGSKATFFILGWVAERFPEIVSIVAERGHEIGSHSQLHRLVYELDREEFRKDLLKSIESIMVAGDIDVRGYRAPSFSIRPDLDWVWEVFSECGITYDSSIFPVKHDTYGSQSAPRFPYRIEVGEDVSVLEIPPSTIPLFGSNIPIAGGGYLRMFPYWFIRRAIKKINAQGEHAVMYFHPWELDIHQEKVDAGTRSRLRHYTNLRAFEPKLRRLLSDFRFSTVEEVFRLKQGTGKSIGKDV